MSEYQRYEFMTIDKPLTGAQLKAVEKLSSHIEATSSHAVIEYHWGDFKHDPIEVLHEFFDGFLYWANWGSPQLAFRFPHGILPADLIKGYDLDDYVTFTAHRDYDILDIQFGEMEPLEMWGDHSLGDLIKVRDELLAGDLRSLYILWLAAQDSLGMADVRDDEEEEEEEAEEDDDEQARVELAYTDEEDDDEENEEDEALEEDDDDDEDEEVDEETATAPAVPPAFKKLTAAQKALAELFQVPEAILVAVAQHSKPAPASAHDDFAPWIALLSEERRTHYLLCLARNEPGLNYQLVRELRELGQVEVVPTSGERVSYATLSVEAQAIRDRLKREAYERKQLEKLERIKSLHDYQDTYWKTIDQAATRGTGSGYDDATNLLNEMRNAATYFNERPAFDARYASWIQSHLRRPALLKRLLNLGFPIPAV